MSKKNRNQRYGPGPGPGVDAVGRPVIDPTDNVKALSEAASKRQDDLRDMEARNVRELMAMREKYEDKLRNAESNRIDAIRAVDVGAVQRAAEVSATQAQTLAAQVAVSAETMRAQVQATATAGTVSLAAALEPIQRDVADLRRVQYEQQGQKAAGVETKVDNRTVMGYVYGAIGILIGLAGMLFALLK